MAGGAPAGHPAIGGSAARRRGRFAPEPPALEDSRGTATAARIETPTYGRIRANGRRFSYSAVRASAARRALTARSRADAAPYVCTTSAAGAGSAEARPTLPRSATTRRLAGLDAAPAARPRRRTCFASFATSRAPAAAARVAARRAAAAPPVGRPHARRNARPRSARPSTHPCV